MIEIKSKADCCGCNACTQICPQNCIKLKEDKEGFLYPEVSPKQCVNCGLCLKVCPVIHQQNKREPVKIFAAKNTDENIRRNSSSGGVFSLLATEVIQEGGIVFGAAFDKNWNVVHDHTDSIPELEKLRGSKYAQSSINYNFKEAERFLKLGKNVMFSGTPCQIAGLKKFLSKEYPNLITVDFVCHGVPSPKIWRSYLHKICSNHSSDPKQITNVNFRDKKLGWDNYSLSISMTDTTGKKTIEFSEPLNKSLYLKGFVRNLYLRPSCYDCSFKSFKSGSDYTLADYWGIKQFHPEFDDNKGISLVFANTSNNLLDKLDDIELIETSFQNAVNQNPSIIKSAKYKSNREKFFQKYEDGSILKKISRYSRWSLKEQGKIIIITILVKAHLLSITKRFITR